MMKKLNHKWYSSKSKGYFYASDSNQVIKHTRQQWTQKHLQSIFAASVNFKCIVRKKALAVFHAYVENNQTALQNFLIFICMNRRLYDVGWSNTKNLG